MGVGGSLTVRSLSRWALFGPHPIGRGGGLVWAFLGLIWSVWALSEWCGTAADLISPVVAPGFVICRAGDRCEHACELGQGAALNVPIDLEGSGKWGLGGNEGVAPSFYTFISKVGWFNGVGLR